MKRFKKVHTKGERKAIKEFHAWIRQQPSCISGKEDTIEPCHVRTWQASGEHWNNIVPMTAEEHKRQHDSGIKTFQRTYAVDLFTLAEQYTAMFCEEKGYESVDQLIGAYDERA